MKVFEYSSNCSFVKRCAISIISYCLLQIGHVNKIPSNVVSNFALHVHNTDESIYMILLNTKTICLAVMLVLFLAFQLTVFFYMKSDDDKVVDVIFSGSKSRNASNVASVTLILDNTDKYFPLEFNEIAIKRRVYRDGTNEYFLNNEKVRLKDITNILLDSGIAKESFNIISQGKIEEILSNKPEERRIIFEEAAGVLKYKRRKEDALRKLDKTHNNMARVNDIINELENRVEPLRIQKDQAIKYNTLTEDLKSVEVALIVNDITNLNFEYQQDKNKIDSLQLEISQLSTNNSVGEAKVAEYKKNITNLEVEIKKYQDYLIKLISDVEKINSRKAIILERQKYNVADSKIHENLILLKEKEYNLNLEITKLDNEIKDIELNSVNISQKLDKENDKLNEIKNNKLSLENELKENIRKENNLNLKIESLRYSVDNNSSLPIAVKKILENPKLRGIHNIIGNLFDTDEKYSLAISTALGASSVNIVTDNEYVAKEAINYLKENKLGRATFFPLNVIKPKYVDSETLNIIKGLNGYLGVASDFITYDESKMEGTYWNTDSRLTDVLPFTRFLTTVAFEKMRRLIPSR